MPGISHRQTPSRPPGAGQRSVARSLAAAGLRGLASLAAVLAATPPALALPEAAVADGALIRDLQVRNTPGDMHVSFALHGAFTQEVREQVESGLPVTFIHYVEVLHRRTAWFDHTLIKKDVSSTVTYDTLTRQYRLTRSVNGEVMETQVTDRPEEMERFMTAVEDLRLCDPAELPGDRRLSLRVKSRIRRRFVLFFIPWNFETDWARIGLSLPAPQRPESPAAPLP